MSRSRTTGARPRGAARPRARSQAAGAAPEPSWAERLERACREQGVPVTVQRRVVLEALAERSDHPSADRLFEAIGERLPGISRATVYRALEALVELGLAARLPSPEGVSRFEARRPRHDHAQCLRCGRIDDLEARDKIDEGRSAPRAPRGFEVHDWSIHLLGVCARCRAGAPARPTREGASR